MQAHTLAWLLGFTAEHYHPCGSEASHPCHYRRSFEIRRSAENMRRASLEPFAEIYLLPYHYWDVNHSEYTREGWYEYVKAHGRRII